MEIVLCCLLWIPLHTTWVPVSDVLSASEPLDLGYLQMYNLEFAAAHQTFREWASMHPEDPLVFSSDAAANLFSEFDRLGVLQSDLFVDDRAFKRRKAPTPDPEIGEAFNRDLATSDRLAAAILERSPDDKRALYSEVLNLGMRGDYAALIQRRDLAGLGYMKKAGNRAAHLLAVDPECYDAYLAVGVENYLLGLNPAPVRWLLRLYGAETNKELGIEKLELTAEKGHYLLPFARLMLAVAALRDHDPGRARELLGELARQFPNNQLYQKELARIH
ncbi:MAG TPA: hypothetical protein VL523_06865 [Terriglobia bacterium]|nr:hypothetical protein [Terriglobia bacterium]